MADPGFAATEPDQVSTAASRTASPSSDSASIVTAIAAPGGTISHGWRSSTVVPSATIPPQLGAGASTSSLRNASPDCTPSATAASRDAWTITTPAIRGRMCRVRMYVLDSPDTSAALTYSSSRTGSVAERTTRMMSGAASTPRVIIAASMLDGKTESTTMMITTAGSE